MGPTDEAGRLGGFPLATFVARRERVLEELGKGAMVLPAAPIQYRSGDSELPYRPDSELFYLSGFTEPESVLVLRGFADSGRSVLFSRSRDSEAELWTGSRAGPDGARALVGVEDARPIDRLAEDLPELLSGAEHVFFRLATSPRTEACVVSALRTARRKGARHGTGPRGIMDPGVILDELRLRKDAAEIGALREAASITVQGFKAALARLCPGKGEWETEADLEAEFRRLGAAGPAFATIVGSGENGCVLHYAENSRLMESGDLVLLDAGAESRMYAADVSRTAPVSGRFSSRQRDIYAVVDEARKEAISLIRPGVRISEVHERTVRTLVQGLRRLTVLSGDEDELIEGGAHRPFFPHRTSHWLGLDTHDVGDYARNGASRKLESGMVLTVEPGLYFAPGGPAPSFAGIGVRVEDDVLVTDEGAEVLTEALPTDAAAVEAMVGTAGT